MIRGSRNRRKARDRGLRTASVPATGTPPQLVDASGWDGLVQLALELEHAGAQVYLPEPVRRDELLAAVRQVGCTLQRSGAA